MTSEGLTLLICGSASCLHEDLSNTEGDKIMVVNEAGAGVYADYLFTLHPDKMVKFKGMSLNPDIETHSTITKRKEYMDDFVDYWHDDVSSSGTSAGAAILLGDKMGFDKIVLCGCPLSPELGYFQETRTGINNDCPRFGAAKETDGFVQGHRIGMQKIKDRLGHKVTSMSGYTKELFNGN